jgi:hypothetical protein
MLLRSVRSITLLLCVLSLTFADAGHPAPTFAAVALKPGDFIVGTIDGPTVVDRSTGLAIRLASGPRFAGTDKVTVGLNGEVYSAGRYIVDDFTTTLAIARIDPATGVAAIVAAGDFQDFHGLTTERNGNRLVLEDERITRVHPSTGTRSLVASGGRIIEPIGLAIENDGSVLTTAALTPNA